MDQLVNNLGQLGGMGLLSGVLLLLHRESIKSFREERALDRVETTKDREQNQAHHELLMAGFGRLYDHITDQSEKLRHIRVGDLQTIQNQKGIIANLEKR